MSDGLFDDKQYATKLTQAEQFGAPPLSLLDAQQGYMRDRKQAWFADYPFLFGATGREEIVVDIWKSEERTDAFGVKLREMTAAPASIFDPALAEICYSWWTILDRRSMIRLLEAQPEGLSPQRWAESMSESIFAQNK